MRMLARPRRVAAPWLVGLLVCAAACGGAGGKGKDCLVGTETCPCYPNATCNSSLACLSQRCVRLPGEAGGGAGGAAAGTGGSAPAPPAGGSSGVADAAASTGGAGSGDGGSSGSGGAGSGGAGGGGAGGAGGLAVDAGRVDPSSPDAAASCIGTANCAVLGWFECSGIPGCQRQGGRCSGYRTDCAEIRDINGCRSVPGCSWGGGSCDDSNGYCSNLTEVDQCMGVQGCKWAGQCVGMPEPCDLFGEDDCKTQPGCKWSGPTTPGRCTGVATSCDRIFVASDCNNTAGCGTVMRCRGIPCPTAPARCRDVQGCEPNNTFTGCTGPGPLCTGGTQGNCQAMKDCQWQAMCIGIPASCFSIPTKLQCDRNAGCQWR